MKTRIEIVGQNNRFWVDCLKAEIIHGKYYVTRKNITVTKTYDQALKEKIKYLKKEPPYFITSGESKNEHM